MPRPARTRHLAFCALARPQFLENSATRPRYNRYNRNARALIPDTPGTAVRLLIGRASGQTGLTVAPSFCVLAATGGAARMFLIPVISRVRRTFVTRGSQEGIFSHRRALVVG